MSVLVRILVQLRCSDYKKNITRFQWKQNISGKKFLTEWTRYSALTITDLLHERYLAAGLGQVSTSPHGDSSIWQNDFFVARSRIPFLWQKDQSEE